VDAWSIDLIKKIMFIIKILLLILLTVVFMLVCIAMFTLAERKLLSAIQRRKGPNVVGFLGLLQPIADGFKLLVKEIILPTKANTVLFIVGPMLSLFLSLIG
jgi:NADH-quinone oxidoreductase subunit H